MFGFSRKPDQAYAQVGLETSAASASPHQLIMLLFDGAISAIGIAKIHTERKEYAEKGAAIGKAIDIVGSGLNASLDMDAGGKLAENLASLYDYIVLRLTWANATNDLATLDECSSLLNELRSAWAEIPNV